MDFDAEQFIAEVQKRPAIWNAKCQDYANRRLKDRAWEELVDIYGGDDEDELSTEQRLALGVTLRKKWRNIRDCFIKNFKIESQGKSAMKKPVQYVFYKNLSFLKGSVSIGPHTNVADGSEGADTGNEDSDDDPLSVHNNFTETPQPLQPKRRIVKKVLRREPLLTGAPKPPNNKIMRRQNLEADGDRLFFLSLVKEFNKIPEPMKIQTKLELLNIIKDAQFTDYKL